METKHLFWDAEYPEFTGAVLERYLTSGVLFTTCKVLRKLFKHF
jgi:hypothetical protein